MNTFAKSTLTAGYFFALIFAIVLMAGSSWYLYQFMTETNAAVERLLPDSTGDAVSYHENEVPSAILATRFAMAGLAFSSCGLCVGIALAFLGLALFLLGARGQMDASAEAQNVSLTISQMSPGALAIVCAAAIIVTCLINRPRLEIKDFDNGSRVSVVEAPAEAADIPEEPEEVPE